MSDPYIGEIRAVAFNYAPDGWVQCNGQTLQVAQYQALYALLGNTFGGQAPTTFAVPDLQGRSILGVGTGVGLPAVTWAEKAGTAGIQIQTANLPAHSHAAVVNDPGHSHTATLAAHTHSFAVPCAPSGTSANQADPNGNVLCSTAVMHQQIANAGTDPGPLSLYVQSPATGSMAAGNTGGVSGGGSSPTSASHTGVTVINSPTGSSQPIAFQPPSLGLYYILATNGVWPTRP